MNEILQQRIEKAADEYIETAIDSGENNFVDEGGMPLFDDDYVKATYIEAATIALQNQWISVEEELPEKDEDGSDTSIYVLVTDSTNPFCYIWKAYYDFTIKEWYDAMSCENLSRFSITHWMSIPSLEGGEK